jgi:tetratricopeptide (TPR) repeat protein
VSTGLSARDIADIIGVPETRVRYWAQIGLVGPTYRDVEHGVEAPRPSYAFADLVAARAARELTERGIPARRVREALATLRAQLPSLDRPLLHLRVLSDGERLIVVGDQPYEPLTGQRVMEFQLDELSQKVARLGEGIPRATRAAPSRPSSGTPVDATRRNEIGSGPTRIVTALEWFERGLLHARAGDVPAAIAALREALALDPTLGPARANLGALLAEDGALDEAETELEAALQTDPRGVEARVNRATLHELRDEPAQALAMWASLIPDMPALPAARAGVSRTVRALRARKAL